LPQRYANGVVFDQFNPGVGERFLNPITRGRAWVGMPALEAAQRQNAHPRAVGEFPLAPIEQRSRSATLSRT